MKSICPKWANKPEGVYPSFTRWKLARVLAFRLPKIAERRLQTIDKTFLAVSCLRLVLKKWRPFGHYADSLSSIFISYRTLLPRINSRFWDTRVAGFEPAREGVKVLCLTAWLYPKTWHKLHGSLAWCPAHIVFLCRLVSPYGWYAKGPWHEQDSNLRPTD